MDYYDYADYARITLVIAYIILHIRDQEISYYPLTQQYYDVGVMYENLYLYG